MSIDENGTNAATTGLGSIGMAVDIAPDGRHLDEAAEIERLGFSGIWVAGGQLDRLEHLADLAGATRSATVAPGIIMPSVHPADAVAACYARMEREHPGRLLVGLGGSHAPGALAELGRYTDRLDAASVPAARRVLAALGPRKLALARDRFAGAITLLTTPENTAQVRRAIGPDRTLVVGQLTVLDDDPVRARAAARVPMEFLSRVPGYRQNFRRMGFTEHEIETLDDRLVDALVAWGDPVAVADRVARHRRAGADHVQIGAQGGQGLPGPLEVARALAGPLLG